MEYKFDEYEEKKIDEFVEKHKDICPDKTKDFTGAKYKYILMPTGIGDNVWIQCSCGEKELISDFENA